MGEPLAFVAHPGYLEGHGLGSSYLLELFADYGFIGIAVYSLILGIFLIYCIDAMKKGWFMRTLMLSLLTNLFYIPRAAATDWLVFLIQIHFWKISTSLPSFVLPIMERSLVPIIKSSWRIESLIPFARHSSRVYFS